MALASLVPFQVPKKSRFSGPTPSNAPRNDVAPLKTIMYHAIKTTGTLIVISCVAGEYSCLQMQLTLKREFSYYLLTIYVPTCMLVIVSWFSFWIDPAVSQNYK